MFVAQNIERILVNKIKMLNIGSQILSNPYVRKTLLASEPNEYVRVRFLLIIIAELTTMIVLHVLKGKPPCGTFKIEYWLVYSTSIEKCFICF